MTDRFGSIPTAAPIEVFALNKRYAEDTFEKKVNLGVGAYRTDEGKPWVLPVVKEAEKQMAADETLNKEYLNVLGLEEFTKAASFMLLGADSPALLENRAFGVQVLSGTGGLRVGAEFLSRVLKYTTYYYSNPTWGRPPDFLAFVICLCMMFLLAAGVKKSLIFNNVLNAINLAVWVFIMTAGLFYVDSSNWTQHGGFLPKGWSGVFTGAATCFYAFIGFDIIATTGEEATNPKKSIPLAIVSSLVIILIAYVTSSMILTLIGNHKLVFNNAGFQEGREYRYWSESKRGLDIDGFLEDLRNAAENSVIILHCCAHNPTGCDPTPEQWQMIADVMEERKLFPFFDSAYQGFASGDLDKDAWSVRYFVERGFELVCAQSFAKNFGLYNERIGNLTFVMNSADSITAVKSQVTIIIRGMYSNPPNHGGRIVAFVLGNSQLYDIWRDCIRTMSSRIIAMRSSLYEALQRLGTPGKWDHITSQIGMFSYTGLTTAQSEYMIEKHHIYMLKSGRISMCGVTPTNVEYVAKSIHDTLLNVTN